MSQLMARPAITVSETFVYVSLCTVSISGGRSIDAAWLVALALLLSADCLWCASLFSYCTVSFSCKAQTLKK